MCVPVSLSNPNPGDDHGDRLVVRQTTSGFDGYYVHQRGSVRQQLDQFSIQVGAKGSCTLLPGNMASGDYSELAKRNAKWTLDRQLSTKDTYVWYKKVRVQKMIARERISFSSREVITWKRSARSGLFTGRGAPRSAPHELPAFPHRKAVPSDNSKRACACAHPRCNAVAAKIAAQTGEANVQANLLRRKKGSKLGVLPTTPTVAEYREPNRSARNKRIEAGCQLQRLCNNERAKSINALRAKSQARALRQGTLDTAVFNVLCHYPAKFVRANKRKAPEPLTTTPAEWGVPPRKKVKNADGDYDVVCVPQMSCVDATQRWIASAASDGDETSASAADDDTSDDEDESSWEDDITYTELPGKSQPSNWSGETKYNLMNSKKYKKRPGLCKRNFGFPGMFATLILLITQTWFPDVRKQRSSMEEGTELTDLEQSLSTLYFFKHASPSNDQKHLMQVWGVKKHQ